MYIELLKTSEMNEVVQKVRFEIKLDETKSENSQNHDETVKVQS